MDVYLLCYSWISSLFLVIRDSAQYLFDEIIHVADENQYVILTKGGAKWNKKRRFVRQLLGFIWGKSGTEIDGWHTYTNAV